MFQAILTGDVVLNLRSKSGRLWRVTEQSDYDRRTGQRHLLPLGFDVQPAQEHGKFNGGVRGINVALTRLENDRHWLVVQRRGRDVVRDEAVRRVDARHGYTAEFAPDPDHHRARYDSEEDNLRWRIHERYEEFGVLTGAYA